jgi:hypothetical protein
MVFYEIHDCEGPIQSVPRFSSVEAAIVMARFYVEDGREGVRIDRVETIWTAEPEGDDNV